MGNLVSLAPHGIARALPARAVPLYLRLPAAQRQPVGASPPIPLELADPQTLTEAIRVRHFLWTLLQCGCTDYAPQYRRCFTRAPHELSYARHGVRAAIHRGAVVQDQFGGCHHMDYLQIDLPTGLDPSLSRARLVALLAYMEFFEHAYARPVALKHFSRHVKFRIGDSPTFESPHALLRHACYVVAWQKVSMQYPKHPGFMNERQALMHVTPQTVLDDYLRPMRSGWRDTGKVELHVTPHHVATWLAEEVERRLTDEVDHVSRRRAVRLVHVHRYRVPNQESLPDGNDKFAAVRSRVGRL